ncbi:hypothetical protein PYW07_016396 [Mythimna separata]|uniref:Uncharacterized protein n=1 Tax=Mythimna separata TaxID=271217 RepID=A0AAD7YKG0_MYTSE|nr:hypothetical protein PYW07_016394 [Mythimna separata]KAJ8718839.1 hypothetical protein PYW07_016395 [Mythimna separata]KAJ8718840.1 hypothetical protein PYW07_016396 [Mythimna separata]
MMYTTAEEPATCVQHLRYRHVKPGLGVMAGHYRLIGDKVLKEPATCVQHLRYRHVKPGLGVMAGHYRLIGDKVLSI